MNERLKKRRGGGRWAVLGAYFGVLAMSHMLWLSLAPLATSIQETYRVGETAVSLLLLVFPLMYILLSWHAGSLIDRKGYRHAILLGSVVTAAFSMLRVASMDFASLLLGQVGIAIGQPYIVNGISKLVADQFDDGQQATATGIGTAGMLVGMAIGLGLTPVLHEHLGFRHTMAVFSATAAMLTFLFYLATGPSGAVTTAGVTDAEGVTLKALLKESALMKLCALWFFAYGAFNGLSTWLEPILRQQGIGPTHAGLVGACMIVGGIAGAFIVPLLADRWSARKPLAIISCLAALVLLWPLCTTGSLAALLGLGSLFGFLFLPGYPIVLAMCEDAAGAARAGAAISLLMLVGNGGVVATIALMPLTNGSSDDWRNSVYLILLLFSLALLVALSLSGRINQRRRAAHSPLTL